MIRWVLLYNLLFIGVNLGSQHLYTRQYTPEDGLRNLEVYWVSIDEHNQVWIHNDVGLFGYYNGIDFTFINKDSLQHTGFLSALLHKNGYTYLTSDVGKLVVFKNDERYFKSISTGILRGPLLYKDRVGMADDPNQTIYFYDENLNAIDSLKFDIGRLKEVKDIDNYVGFGMSYCMNKPHGYLYNVNDGAGIIFYKETGEYFRTNRGHVISKYLDLLISSEKDGSKVEIATPVPGKSLEFNKIHSFAPNYLLAKFIENQSRSFLLLQENDSSKTIYALYEILPGSVERIGAVNYPQIDFQARLDSNNIFWGASHEGLYKVNPSLLEFSSNEENMINSLHSLVEDEEGNIWFAGYKTGMAVYDGTRITKAPPESFINSNYLPGGTQINGKAHFLNSSTQPIVVPSKSGINRKKLIFTNAKVNKNPTGYMIKELDGTIYMGLRDKALGIVESMYDSKWNVRTISKEKGLKLDNVLTIAKDQDGRIWVGRSSQGVAVYDPEIDSAFTWRIGQEVPESFGSISSTMDSRGNLWLGTNKGLYFIDKPHQVEFGDDLFRKAIYIPFPDNNRTMVAAVIESNGYIVAENNTAVNFIVLDSFYQSNETPLIFSLKYGEDIGGDGTEQNCMLNDSKGYLWIGSHSGATRMDIKNFPFNNDRIEIEMTGVKVGQQSVEDPTTIITIPKDNRNFSISLRPKINTSLQNNIYYSYELVSSKNDTLLQGTHINRPEILMNYIPPGSYKLYVSAFKNGRKHDDLVVNVKVPYTLSENPFFWAGILGITLIGLASFIIIRGRQKRMLLERDLALSKMEQDKTNLQVQAIISSFNPHFINNSLHWAQSRYKKDQSLVTLIGRLSKNIQYIFTKTRAGKAYHTLAEELELVKNYTTIQKIRFDDGFQLILPDENTLHKYGNITILLMQLQIHVENAIEHGLRNRMESSFVKIEIEEEPSHFIIHVIDDGAGRMKARELNSRGTQKGTNMLEELHHIFNQKNLAPIKTHYEDNIYSDAGTNEGYGTRVSITLPKNYSYEIEET